MRFRVKDYCRIILYLPSEEKLKASYAPQKPKRIEDDVDMRLSEDETPIEPEDAHRPSAHHRAPSYNPEDYAHALAKYSRAPNLYIHDPKDKKGRGKDKEKSGGNKDSTSEMALKQFASLPELLRRLREDLKTAYISFVKELVRDPHDGVSQLLDLLKMIQLAQSNLTGSATNREQQIALRRTLIDEFECLSCLRCCLRCSDAAPRLANYRNGLYVLAAATMSSLTRSRTLALQLLTKACENSVCGHRQVIEAFSTLRLRFAEPVRCKFLISMMLSYPHPSFQIWGLKLVNALLLSAVSLRERVYLQEEMTEAGFDPAAIRKALEHRGAATAEQQEAVRAELDKWGEGYIDLAALEEQLSSLKSTNTSLKQELHHLRQANMKLLEENVLVKAVGGEVEERCSALQRRLEKYGIPSAPSPTPSVTDSEVSSFVTTGRSTVRRNPLDSPTQTMDRNSIGGTMDTSAGGGGNGEKSMSLEWKMIRPPPEGRGGPSRGLSREGSRRDSHEGSEPPVPKKRQLLVSPDLASRRSVYVNEMCKTDLSMNGNDSRMSHSELRVTTHNDSQMINNDARMSKRDSKVNHNDGKPNHNEEKIASNDKASFQSRPNSRLAEATSSTFSDLLTENGTGENTKTKVLNGSTFEEEHIYQSPVKPSRPKSRKKSSSSKSSSSEKEERPKIKGTASPKSLSSSTSSLSSSTSLDGVNRKDAGEHEYENLPKPEDGSTSKNSANNSNEKLGKKRRTNSAEEGEIEYERDVVVYEAITLGNDTILFDKGNHSSTNSSSDGSNKSKTSNASGNSNKSFDDGPCVRQSVRHYENLVNKGDKESSGDGPKEEDKAESRGILNGLINGLRNNKKNVKKEAKKSKQNDKEKEKSDDVSEREVEAVMNGFENILKSAESSISLGSMGTVKENPLLRENIEEDRASPDQPTDEIEIVPNRIPQIPPRSKSRATSSQSSRSRTPDPVLYLESPSETSDTDTLQTPRKGLPSPYTVDTASTKSFGWIRADAGIRRRDTFVDRSPGKERRVHGGLRRSESVHVNNLSEYNSHRSYSPRRRGSTEMLVPLEESEVQISGRRYTQYTAAEVEHRNKVNNLISSEMKRRRNRSFDDRLDQWLDQDCLRQPRSSVGQFEDFSRCSRRDMARINDDIVISRSSRSPRKGSSSDPRSGSGQVKSRSTKNSSRYSAADMTAFNGFKNPTTGLRESDYGPNFMLNSPPNQHHLEEVLSDLVEFGGASHGGSRMNRLPRKLLREEDPAIPTPDYSATPAGTLTNENGVPPGRHILDMASGLY